MNLTNTRIQNTYGGLLNIGSLGLTGSQPITDGFGNELPIEVSETNVNFTGTVSGLVPVSYLGAFYDTTDQAIAVVNTPQVININSTDKSNGITLTSGNRVTIQNPRTYNMQVTFLVECNSGSREDVVFWLKFNGTDYPNSGHFTTVPARKSVGNPSRQVINFGFIGTSLTAGDYVQIYWQSTSTDVKLKAVKGSGYPDSNSVSVNIFSI